MVQRTNSFEGGTQGTTLTAGSGGNTGGASGNFFDSVTVGGGCAFDNTHVLHGALACKYTNAAASVATQWQTLGIGAVNCYFRTHCYYTAAPSGNARLFSWQNAALTVDAIMYISSAQKLVFADSTGGAILTSTTTLPVNQWFRVEGFFFPSATVGIEEFKIFLNPDSTVADETQTSGATVNTGGTGVDRCSAGPSSAVAITYWLDDVAVTDTGYLGPAAQTVPLVTGRPGKTWQRRFQHRQILTAPAPAGAVTITATATLAGAGAVTALVTQDAGTSTSLAGVGAVTALVTEIPATANLAGAGTLGPVPVTQAVIASPAGAGAVTDVITQGVTASPSGTGSVTNVVTEAVKATAAGAGAVNGLVTLPGGGTITGSGSVGTAVTQGVIASLAGAGSVTDVITLICIAAIAGAGAVNASVTGAGSTANLAGAGAVSAVAVQAVTAAAQGAGQVTAAAAQQAPSALAGAGSLTAAGAITGTASLNGAGHVSAAAAQISTSTVAAAGTLTALPAQAAAASLAAQGSVTAVSTLAVAFTVGALTAADKPGSLLAPAMASSVLTGATAPQGTLTAASAGASAAGYPAVYAAVYGTPLPVTLTAADSRTGGPG